MIAGMRILVSLGALLALLVAPPAARSADLSLPDSFAGWKSARVLRFADQRLEEVARGDAEVLREYGATGGEQRQFESGGGRLAATLYRFRDLSGAYGMFTFWRSADMAPLRLPAAAVTGAAANDARLIASFGSYLIEVQGTGLRGLVEVALREMISRLAQTAGEPGPLPTLPAYLPKVGLIENSDRYVLGIAALERLHPFNQGDWVGFAYGAEVELARYQIGDQTQTLLLALYPTPQIAIERGRELERYFALNEEKPKGKLPPAFFKRAGPLVALVVDTGSASVSSFLLDRVDYRWNVTWSERASRKDEPGWGPMLVTIFVGTGLLLLFTVIASLAFAGFRVLMATYLPGRVFDRPSASEIIQLHLDRK